MCFLSGAVFVFFASPSSHRSVPLFSFGIPFFPPNFPCSLFVQMKIPLCVVVVLATLQHSITATAEGTVYEDGIYGGGAPPRFPRQNLHWKERLLRKQQEYQQQQQQQQQLPVTNENGNNFYGQNTFGEKTFGKTTFGDSDVVGGNVGFHRYYGEDTAAYDPKSIGGYASGYQESAAPMPYTYAPSSSTYSRRSRPQHISLVEFDRKAAHQVTRDRQQHPEFFDYQVTPQPEAFDRDATGRFVLAGTKNHLPDGYEQANEAARELSIVRTNPVLNFARGAADGVIKTAEGIVQVVSHPIETAALVAEAAAHPIDSTRAIIRQIKKSTEKEGISHTFGMVASDIGMAVIPGKVITSVLSTGSRVGEAGVVAGGIAEVTDTAADVGKVAKAADATSDVAKTADLAGDAGKAADAAGDAGKGGAAAGEVAGGSTTAAEVAGEVTAHTSRATDYVGNTVEAADVADKSSHVADVANNAQNVMDTAEKASSARQFHNEFVAASMETAPKAAVETGSKFRIDQDWWQAKVLEAGKARRVLQQEQKLYQQQLRARTAGADFAHEYNSGRVGRAVKGYRQPYPTEELPY